MQNIKFTVSIERARLRAALIFAGKKDVRYYLNGVCLHVDGRQNVRLVATDGARLSVINCGQQKDATPGAYILPRELVAKVKKAARNGLDYVHVTIDGARAIIDDPHGEIIGGDKLIDSKFPDFERVIPQLVTMTREAGHYDPAFLADIRAAVIELGDKTGVFHFIQAGNNAGMMASARLGLLCVVMPYRADDAPDGEDVRAFLPSAAPTTIIECGRPWAGEFPRDSAQDVSDKRKPAAPAVVAHCTPDLVPMIDPTGALQAAGLLVVDMPAAPDEGAQTSEEKSTPAPLAMLRHYITDSINRGENTAIIEIKPEAAQDSGEPSPSAPLIAGRWIPGGAENGERVAFDVATGGEVWIVPSARNPGQVAAIAYGGKRTKHDGWFLMRDRARALEWAGEYMAGLSAQAARKAERQAEKKAKRAAGHKLTVGDVLRCSWGYDQTNIDYYEVTRLIGMRMVEIREIGADSVESGNMTGECVPRPGHYIGAPMRKAVSDYDGQSVRIASYASAHKIEPRIVGGAKVYPVDHWTAYA